MTVHTLCIAAELILSVMAIVFALVVLMAMGSIPWWPWWKRGK